MGRILRSALVSIVSAVFIPVTGYAGPAIKAGGQPAPSNVIAPAIINDLFGPASSSDLGPALGELLAQINLNADPNCPRLDLGVLAGSPEERAVRIREHARAYRDYLFQRLSASLQTDAALPETLAAQLRGWMRFPASLDNVLGKAPLTAQLAAAGANAEVRINAAQKAWDDKEAGDVVLIFRRPADSLSLTRLSESDDHGQRSATTEPPAPKGFRLNRFSLVAAALIAANHAIERAIIFGKGYVHIGTDTFQEMFQALDYYRPGGGALLKNIKPLFYLPNEGILVPVIHYISSEEMPKFFLMMGVIMAIWVWAFGVPFRNKKFFLPTPQEKLFQTSAFAVYLGGFLNGIDALLYHGVVDWLRLSPNLFMSLGDILLYPGTAAMALSFLLILLQRLKFRNRFRG